MKVQVNIRDYHKTPDQTFPFELGRELIIDGYGNKARVEDAVWEGNDARATFYKVTYTVKTTDGHTQEMDLRKLLQFNRRSH